MSYNSIFAASIHFVSVYRLSHNKKHQKGLLFKNKSVPYEKLGSLKNLCLISAKQRKTSEAGWADVKNLLLPKSP